MVHLKIVSGKMAGRDWATRHLPVQIGRSASAAFRAEDDGVWERHLQLDFDPAEGIVLTVQPGAIATVNGQPVQRATLRNGDLIGCGSLKLQFWLAPPRQKSLWPRELVTWTLPVLISAAQLLLIYWLAK